MSPTKFAAQRDPASFRDPSGYVCMQEDRVLRIITSHGQKNYELVRDAGILVDLMENKKLVESKEIPFEQNHFPDAAYVVEHQTIPVWSYPYEWTFSQLKDAALLTLDLLLELLPKGFTLSDASAYNIQFHSAQPVLVDLLSIVPYEEGQYWTAHKQFCEHFILPLLIEASSGIPVSETFRAYMDGVPLDRASALVSFKRRLSINYALNIGLPNRFNRKTLQSETVAPKPVRPLPKSAFEELLKRMRSWVASLKPKEQITTWNEYTLETSYTSKGTREKLNIVANLAAKHPGTRIIDLGCNHGQFSDAVLKAGAASVISVDADYQVLDRLYNDARSDKKNMNIIYADLSNPAPFCGWRGAERKSFESRCNSDGVLALALIHHLCIGKNIPLTQVVDFLTNMGSFGIIEFVPKSDPQVKRMLAMRDDIFEDYTLDHFLEVLSQKATIENTYPLPESERVLVHFVERR